MDAELAWATGLVVGCMMKGGATVDVPTNEDGDFTSRIRFTFPETTIGGEPRWYEMTVTRVDEAFDLAEFRALIVKALGTDGAQHKQWFLHRLALLLDPDTDLRFSFDPGVPV